MNLEQRPVVFEDIGRQVLATGFRRRPEYFIQEIGTFFLKIFLFKRLVNILFLLFQQKK